MGFVAISALAYLFHGSSQLARPVTCFFDCLELDFAPSCIFLGLVSLSRDILTASNPGGVSSWQGQAAGHGQLAQLVFCTRREMNSLPVVMLLPLGSTVAFSVQAVAFT